MITAGLYSRVYFQFNFNYTCSPLGSQTSVIYRNSSSLAGPDFCSPLPKAHETSESSAQVVSLSVTAFYHTNVIFTSFDFQLLINIASKIRFAQVALRWLW